MSQSLLPNVRGHDDHNKRISGVITPLGKMSIYQCQLVNQNQQSFNVKLFCRHLLQDLTPRRDTFLFRDHRIETIELVDEFIIHFPGLLTSQFDRFCLPTMIRNTTRNNNDGLFVPIYQVCKTKHFSGVAFTENSRDETQFNHIIQILKVRGPGDRHDRPKDWVNIIYDFFMIPLHRKNKVKDPKAAGKKPILNKNIQAKINKLTLSTSLETRGVAYIPLEISANDDLEVFYHCPLKLTLGVDLEEHFNQQFGPKAPKNLQVHKVGQVNQGVENIKKYVELHYKTIYKERLTLRPYKTLEISSQFVYRASERELFYHLFGTCFETIPSKNQAIAIKQQAVIDNAIKTMICPTSSKIVELHPTFDSILWNALVEDGKHNAFEGNQGELIIKAYIEHAIEEVESNLCRAGPIAFAGDVMEWPWNRVGVTQCWPYYRIYDIRNITQVRVLENLLKYRRYQRLVMDELDDERETRQSMEDYNQIHPLTQMVPQLEQKNLHCFCREWAYKHPKDVTNLLEHIDCPLLLKAHSKEIINIAKNRKGSLNSAMTDCEESGNSHTVHKIVRERLVSLRQKTHQQYKKSFPPKAPFHIKYDQAHDYTSNDIRRAHLHVLGDYCDDHMKNNLPWSHISIIFKRFYRNNVKKIKRSFKILHNPKLPLLLKANKVKLTKACAGTFFLALVRKLQIHLRWENGNKRGLERYYQMKLPGLKKIYSLLSRKNNRIALKSSINNQIFDQSMKQNQINQESVSSNINISKQTTIEKISIVKMLDQCEKLNSLINETKQIETLKRWSKELIEMVDQKDALYQVLMETNLGTRCRDFVNKKIKNQRGSKLFHKHNTSPWDSIQVYILAFEKEIREHPSGTILMTILLALHQRRCEDYIKRNPDKGPRGK